MMIFSGMVESRQGSGCFPKKSTWRQGFAWNLFEGGAGRHCRKYH